MPCLGILFQFHYNPRPEERSKETSALPLLNAKSLEHWLILYTKKGYEAAVCLKKGLQSVTPGMGILMRDAKM